MSHSSIQQDATELKAALLKKEQDLLVSTKTLEAQEGELKKLREENKQLIDQLATERTQKLALIEKQKALQSKLSLNHAQKSQYESRSNAESQENNKLKTELEDLKLQKVGSIKDKQNALNKLVVAQSKLEALSLQTEYYTASIRELKNEVQRLTQENSALNKRLMEGGLMVKTQIREDPEARKQLQNQFQQQLKQKELKHSQEVLTHQTTIQKLKLRIAQLEVQSASKTQTES